MAIQIDGERARQVLIRASTLAKSDGPVPEQWIQFTRMTSNPTWKTQIALLGTSLLARAVDVRANPFALKADALVDNAYSARTLCHGVLVPFAWENGYDLGVTGREPLNNQPWF